MTNKKEQIKKMYDAADFILRYSSGVCCAFRVHKVERQISKDLRKLYVQDARHIKTQGLGYYFSDQASFGTPVFAPVNQNHRALAIAWFAMLVESGEIDYILEGCR